MHAFILILNHSENIFKVSENSFNQIWHKTILSICLNEELYPSPKGDNVTCSKNRLLIIIFFLHNCLANLNQIWHNLTRDPHFKGTYLALFNPIEELNSFQKGTR